MRVTQRAVLSVGDFCNSNCRFCYFRHKKRRGWEDIDRLKKEVDKFRYFYRLEFIDIWGGEPTIYPDILKLVRYCSNIGLKPTLITNSFALEDKNLCLRLKQAGINDFLVSINGLGKNAEIITGVRDAAKKQERAIKNLVDLGIPFRINTTLHKLVLEDLLDIARLAVKTKAKVMNVIMFNPYYEWQDITDIDFQLKYKEISSYVSKTIKFLEKNKIESNIRYIPLCMLKGFEKNNYNYMQRSYDQYEWNENACSDFCLFNPKEKWFDQVVLRIRRDLCYLKSDRCKKCSLNYICDGFHNQYVKKFGFGEERPYTGETIKDPKHFIKNQKRVKLLGEKPDISRLRIFLEKGVFLYFLKRRWKYFVYKFKQVLGS